MKITRSFILFFLLLGTISFAQNKFYFDFDYAQFGYDSISNYVEFYYSFNQNSLTVNSTDSADYQAGVLKIVLTDTLTGETIVDREWRINHLIFDSTDMMNKSLIGVVSFIIPEGNFKGEISGYDYYDPENKKIISENLQITPILLESEKLVLSDIQLASKLITESEDTSSIFYKNSLEVVPIPTSVFGENQLVLFYYLEIYNIIKDADDTQLLLNTLVYNSNRNVVLNKNKLLSRNVRSRVEAGSVTVTKYPTGSYTLALTLVDSSGNYAVSSSKRFFVYNPSVPSGDSSVAGDTDIFSSEFGLMSEEELDDLFSKSKYVASSFEVEQYERINTLEGKKEFLFKFWKARDQDPSTPKNEYFNEYLSRASASNDRFGSLSRIGWKSDRGRIFMTYGEPSEIERFPNQIDSKPYEIWYYNEIEGGVMFVFADLTGFSDYTLLHSTMRGELRDDNWSRRISSF